MEDTNPTMASLIFELIREIFGCVGNEFNGGGVAMGVIMVGGFLYLFLFRNRGGFLWCVVCVFWSLLVIGGVMAKTGSGFGEAVSNMFIIGGIGSATICNLIAILTGNYWKIKRNFILAGVGIGLGLLVGAFV